MMADKDYDWKPPTEAEMKIIQARRERSDRISKIMGDYLLKGYKMLGSCCENCSTIFLEDKQGRKYCIACQELDTDTDKDDPVVNPEAARSQVAESCLLSSGDRQDLPPLATESQRSASRRDTTVSNVQHIDIPPATQNGLTSSSFSSPLMPQIQCTYPEAVEILCQKIKWASDELKQSTSVDTCIQLCNLIKSSADAVYSLKQIQT